jgi:tetratricopeptide (TPR) repeat protein
MRQLTVIFLLFVCFDSHSQEWRDSLKVARDAYKKQEYTKALKYYQSAQKNAPADLDLSDEMGQSAYKAREFEKAEKIYQQSAASKKDAASKAKSYHNMGNSRMQSKDYNGAIDAYKEALRNNPKDEQTRYNLSEAIRRFKDEQKKNQQQNQNNQNTKNNPNQNNTSGNQGKQNQNNQQQNPNSKGGEKEEPGSGNPSKLPNKTVERILDNLMKAEAATKRKMNGNGTGGSTTTSGKDW